MRQDEIQSIKQRFGIIGNSAKLNYAIHVAAQVAPTEMNVLIMGESGTGKESFSKIIHSLSPRKHGQFIAINCGAIPEGTIDSELFGHEKGAFTDAREARKGFFEVTDGGTIFLDEIGEMPLGTQSRLLRVLENGEFIRVGSNKVQKTSVRVVAATNVDLLKAVEQKKFREDLYFRLSTVPISVPALRERDSDILLLFRKFASDFAEEYRVKPIKLSEDASQALGKYRFPGNIRQLKNLTQQMSLLEMEQEINVETLAKYIPAESTSGPPALLGNRGGQDDFSERDLLYKILFDMRKDVTELKKLVFELLNSGNYGSVISDHKDLFNGINDENPAEAIFGQDRLLPSDTSVVDSSSFQDNSVIEIADHLDDLEDTQDIQHEEENDSLSLEEQEKELIIKALKKNKNKRKYAARDLGISERTLYRKIKQYEIEKQK
ncbi:sigma-54 interaction domain-containing protein [Microscilla marina]|uniref:Transcriptional regulator n=1 Tax=Microscilla marina ATCC 23134 TaxID=313606 RepID=A1ZC87_MICM2|nr:sigma-54 dependent transcriptional regulator [Microscilla marina]EAY31889.1 transcriptional regulator [Microscilla marina ATCC 23134]